MFLHGIPSIKQLQAPLTNKSNMGNHPLQIGKQMARDQHCALAKRRMCFVFRVQRARKQGAHKFAPGHGVQAGDRFIEQQQIGVVRQRQHHRKFLLVSARQFAHRASHRQIQLHGQRQGTCFVPPRIGPAYGFEHLKHFHPLKQIWRLGHKTQSFAHSVRQTG